MIKFFRTIRKDLMERNKTGKYFKYAIGEIILVVVGILIALQINNWNNSKLEQQTEINILNEINLNLSTDIKNINLKIEANNRFLKSNQNVLTHLKGKTAITKSLEKDYAYLIGHGNFRPVTSGYQNLNSQGVSIIKNNSLRAVITELYDSKYYVFVDGIYHSYGPFRDFKIKPIIDNLVTTKPYESSRPKNLKKLQNDLSFQEVLTWNIFHLNRIDGLFKKGIDEMVFTQKMIKEELIRIKK